MGALLEFSTALGYCLGQAPYSGIAPACGPYVPHFWQLLDTNAGRFMNKVLSWNREFYGPVHWAYNRSIWYWMYTNLPWKVKANWCTFNTSRDSRFALEISPALCIPSLSMYPQNLHFVAFSSRVVKSKFLVYLEVPFIYVTICEKRC